MMDTSVMEDRIGQLCGQSCPPWAPSRWRFHRRWTRRCPGNFPGGTGTGSRGSPPPTHQPASGVPAALGKTWETFEHDRVPLALRQQRDHLAQGSFVERGVNVLAFGLPGTGKTHALCALGHRLVEAGWPLRTLRSGLPPGAGAVVDLPRQLRKGQLRLPAGRPGLAAPGRRVESEVLFIPDAERYERRSLGMVKPGLLGVGAHLRQRPPPRRLTGSCNSVILEFDVPSYRTNAEQQRGQAKEVNRQN